MTCLPKLLQGLYPGGTELGFSNFCSRIQCGVSRLTVFIGASFALIVSSGIGVLAGHFISKYISGKHLNYIAGIGFICIGIWSFLKA